VRDANDRFANAQTNYLLQRIETFEGIVILTSNSRSRFDAAFERGLDVIVDFPLPGPEDRRALRHAHLGSRHRLTQREINQLAARVDLCEGYIRNAVLTAAALAREEVSIAYAHVVLGLAST
jgi:SpoVK/Ycf46/Vps4 family AAA+-type ATPase